MTVSTTQRSRILKTLRTSTATKSPGISVAQLATRAKVPVDSVYRRVWDLRQEGFDIYTNSRWVGNEKRKYYRFAGFQGAGLST